MQNGARWMSRTPLPGSVFKRSSDGRWVAQIRRLDPATGRTKPVRRYASSEKKAEDLLRQLRAGTEEASRRQTRPGMTVADWVDHWADHSLPVSKLKPGTRDLYSQMARTTLRDTLGDVRLDLFTPTEAEKWLARLAQVRRLGKAKGPEKVRHRDGKVISASRQRTAFNALSRALDTAVRDGLIQTNPLRQVARPTPSAAAVRAADADQVDTILLPSCEDWALGPLVIFVALTGCRIGEALSLEWADVDLKAATAELRRSSARTDTTKGGRARVVPLLPEVVRALRRQRQTQRQLQLRLGAGWPASGLVFTSAVGTPMHHSNARRRLRTRLGELGMPSERPYHTLRHGLAARLLRRDVPMPVVSALLGHSSIRVTVDVYGHVQPALHADQLAAAMRGSPSQLPASGQDAHHSQ